MTVNETVAVNSINGYVRCNLVALCHSGHISCKFPHDVQLVFTFTVNGIFMINHALINGRYLTEQKVLQKKEKNTIHAHAFMKPGREYFVLFTIQKISVTEVFFLKNYHFKAYHCTITSII